MKIVTLLAFASPATALAWGWDWSNLHGGVPKSSNLPCDSGRGKPTATVITSPKSSPTSSGSASQYSVKTSSGTIIGHPGTYSNNVWQFLGIPFAKPPVGKLRFMPPEPYDGNGTTFNANKYSPSCPANNLYGKGIQYAANASEVVWAPHGIEMMNLIGNTNVSISENCLNLNVWTPRNMSGPPKAVMLWIYGGAFVYGSNSNPGYIGDFLTAEQDIVLVTLNYRTNIFGFPGAPGQKTNLGLLDQRLAVEWTKSNIAAFNGDPSRITLFGQSAGSASLDYYSFAYPKDPIVSGIIAESGSLLSPSLAPNKLNSTFSSWRAVAIASGCNRTTDAAIFSCMQSAPLSSILPALLPSANESKLIFGLSGYAASSKFAPTVDNITVFSDYPARFKAKKFAQLPLLTGSTNYELGLFSVSTFALTGVTLPDSIWKTQTYQVFGCPAAQRAAYNLAAGLPTWRYKWFGDFVNSQLTYKPFSAAYHASELPLVFGTSHLVGPDTKAEQDIGKFLRGGWAAFAKDPIHGLSKYKWPQFNPNTTSLIRLAYNNQTGTNLASASLYDGNCSTLTY